MKLVYRKFSCNSPSIVKPLFVPSLLAAALLSASIATAQSVTTRTETNANTLTDGQILQVVRILNDGEIQQAELALDAAEDQQAKDVAQVIINDHELSNEKIEALVDEGIDLESSDLSEMLQAQAHEVHETLADLSDDELACTYLQKQVDQHETAIEMVSTQLQADADSPEVREMLVAKLPVLERHLISARAPLQGAPLQC